MAAGKVLTGFSKPYVALYANLGGDGIDYTDGQLLARGVSVAVAPDAPGDDNIFYADNSPAETVSGTFTGGTVTLTVDGLFDTAEALIYGLPAATATTVGASTVDVYKYGDGAVAPDCGVGWIERYMSDGVTTYVARALRKVKFQPKPVNAATQEEEIDWQTTELTATIMRDDSDNREWQWFTEDLDSEADAYAALLVMLS